MEGTIGNSLPIKSGFSLFFADNDSLSQGTKSDLLYCLERLDVSGQSVTELSKVSALIINVAPRG